MKKGLSNPETGENDILSEHISNEGTVGKKKKKTAREKLEYFWKDKRPFKKRLINALFAAFAFTYTFVVFGPVEIYISNMSFMVFGIKYLVPSLILSGVIIFALLTALLSLAKGRLHNYLVTAFFALTVAGYIQGNFLNIDHGSLDGAEVIWKNFKGEMLLNTLVWFVIIAVPFIVAYFSGKIWKYMVRIVSGALILVQTVAFAFLLAKTPITNVTDNGFINRDGIFEVSPNKNVIVFMLDRFDKKYFDIQMKYDKDLESKLDGFTYYENFTGSYSRTFPSVTYLLTGVKNDYTLSSDEYFKKAWNETKFLPGIKEAGYGSKIYTEITYVAGKAENLVNSIDNFGFSPDRIRKDKVFSAMMTLSAYRYTPESMKPYFHIYTGDISYEYIYGQTKQASVYGTNDAAIFRGVTSGGITDDGDSDGEFIFYHLQGAHDPFNMDENGVEHGTTGLGVIAYANYDEYQRGQVRGNFKMIFSYIEQLKQLGVYDDTTIIITADHGRTGTLVDLEAGEANKDPKDGGGERVLTLLIKPANADTNEPMKRSMKQICQDNLRASIMSYFGLDHSQLGRSIEDIGEDEDVERYFYMSGSNPSKTKRDVNLITYKIVGDANDFSNWSVVSKEKMEKPYYDTQNKIK